MIIYTLLIIFIYFIKILISPLNFLPPVSIPGELEAKFGDLKAFLGEVNIFLPVNTILAVLGLILTIEAGFIIFRIVKFILSRT